jgi:hypothetical protein
LVAYCSIMTLLLAFFIILQAFAPQQTGALFYAGQGSFIRALKTFGLGGVLDRVGGRAMNSAAGPRYLAPEGPSEPPRLRRIDPEIEEAQRALQTLEDQFDVREPKQATGYRVELSTPCTYGPGKTELTAEEQQFLKELAPRLQRVLLARGFVIRIGATLGPAQTGDVEQTRAALEAAGQVRQDLIASMSEAVRPVAARRTYSFCCRDSSDSDRPASEAGQLKIDVILTKPYVRELRGERTNGGEESTAT